MKDHNEGARVGEGGGSLSVKIFEISDVKWLHLVHPRPCIFQLNTLNNPTHLLYVHRCQTSINVIIHDKHPAEVLK